MTDMPPSLPRGDHGFVLPYVLLVIAILAIAGTIAAQRLSRATEVVSDMQIKMDSERVLHSAEAAATYSFLTGNPRGAGYDLSPESPIAWEFGFLSADGRSSLRESDVKSIPQDIWQANGGARRYDVPSANTDLQNSRALADKPVEAVISLQDTSGLISLNQVNSSQLSAVLQQAGAQRREAEQLANTLWDYIDFDTTKRPNGAEERDYKRRKMPVPSNSPLRSFEELSSLIYWDELIQKLDMLKLKDLTTINAGRFRKAFASPSQINLFNLDSPNLLGGLRPSFEELLEINNPDLSGGGRIRIWAQRPDGQFDKRVIEIKRTLLAADVPYRRHWVYDATVLESDLETSITPIDTKGGRLKLDGLKHVVHAAPPTP